MEGELYHAVGKRKTAIARVWMRPGQGQITINKKSLDEYFETEFLREIPLQPLKLLDLDKAFDIYVNVLGGGKSGQAQAIRHGISKALLQVDERFRPILKKAGLITRDPRVKERKKYGQPGARKKYQYSKR